MKHSNMQVQEFTKNICLIDRTLLLHGKSSSILIEPGYDMVVSGKFSGSSVEKVLERTRLFPIRVIGITHSHGDHVGNFPFYGKRLTEDFDVVLHSSSPLLEDEKKEPIFGTISSMPIPPKAHIQMIFQDTVYHWDGIECHVLCTPGHSYMPEDLSFFFPESKILYLGDLLQPQGPSYELADGVSPVPLFYNGTYYLETLQKLLDIPFQTIITGHGDVYSQEKGKNALQVTLQCVQRMKYWAERIFQENPKECLETICIQAYDKIVQERHFDLSLATKRKTEENCYKKTDYELFDRPGLRYFVEVASKK